MSDERNDVLNLYICATYEHARYADLHLELENDQWDEFTKEAGERAFEMIAGLIDDRLNAIEEAKERAVREAELEAVR